MKHLITSGCSFTSLTKPNIDFPVEIEIPLQHKRRDMWTWVDWIRHYNEQSYSIYNYGCPTNDNDTIVESTLYGINKLLKRGIPSNDIEVIIQWTCATRNSFFIPNGFIDKNKIVNAHTNDFVDEKRFKFEKGFKYLTGGYNKTEQPAELNDITMNYLALQFSHHERIINWLKNIILISSYCKSKGIKYKFFQLNNNISSYYYNRFKGLSPKQNKMNTEPHLPIKEDLLKTKDIEYTWDDTMFIDNPYINYLVEQIDFNSDFWFYEINNHHKFGGSLEWTINEWNDNIEDDSGFELSNIVYYELENKTEEEIKEFFRTKSYGHPSSLMWRKFYFEILKPNFL